MRTTTRIASPLSACFALGAALAFSCSPVAAQITGFNAANYTLNSNGTGNPAINVAGTTLTLTDNAGNEARSAFFNTKQSINAFTALFTYTASGQRGADGITFTIQNTGPNALGGFGGSLGYAVIGQSVAYEMNIYGGATIGTTVGTNGAVGNYLSNSPVNISNGNPIQVSLNYSAGSLSETLTDATAATTYTHTFAVDIPATVNGSTAYVGFTGATGGGTSTQTISNYSFRPAVTNTPEPGSIALLIGTGLSGSVFAFRRRNRNRK